MRVQAGLWVDHHRAVLFGVQDRGVEIKEITGVRMRHLYFTGSPSSAGGSMEDAPDLRSRKRRLHYSEGVVAVIRKASAIQILGLDEVRGEPIQQLEYEGREDYALTITAVDEMSDCQITARVRVHNLN